ncbi:MAG: hypothetical protein Q8R58_12680 [Sulfuricurvum sp.]|nr:hypothetical protein [Sulfuricurvum sp.]
MKSAQSLSMEDYALFLANIELLKLKYQTPKHQDRHPHLHEMQGMTFKLFVEI